MIESLKEKLAAVRKDVESGIDKMLPAADLRPQNLHCAMRYSVEAGGKRIRPALLILASELFPKKGDPLAAAVAIECLHTYTLIHDDLPSVDDSDFRRGRLACHKQFDEATALLSGDALLTHAFELLAVNYAEAPELAAALVADLATASNSQHLIGGQMEDIENEGKQVNADSLHFIHRNKTAALIIAALVMGLRFADPDHSQVELMREAGFHLGMNFQIVDDILDASSDSETMGKPVGNDAAADKSTYVALYGIEGARNEAQIHSKAAIDAIKRLGGQTELLTQLVSSISERAH